MKRTGYLLDSNVLMHVANMAEGHERILEKLTVLESHCFISAITAHELRFKIETGPGKVKAANIAKLGQVLKLFKCLEFPCRAALRAAVLRATLSRAGKTIGYADALIAAHACEIGYVCVTDNVSEYRRLAGLAIENWRADS